MLRALGVTLLPLVGLLALGCRDAPPAGIPASTEVAPDSTDTLRILLAGDAMQHKEQFASARQPDGSYRYDDCFRYVQPYIAAAHLAIVNLETTLPGPPYAGYPNFRSPDAYLAALQAAGFDLVTLANNHSVDAGNAGVLRTIRVADSLGLPHLGTYRSPDDRDRRTPLLIERRGITLALLNYTYGTNYQFTTPPVSVNYIDTLQLKADLAAARRSGADATVVLFHWGLEYKLEPLPDEEALADLCFREGATLVLGGHPHVVRRADRLTYDGRSVAVAYSTGNFISAQRHPNTDGGMLLGLTLVKDRRSGTVTVADAGYHLVWVNRRPRPGRDPVYELLPVADVESGRLQPQWEANGRAKLDRFAAAARAVLAQSTGVPELPAGRWLGRPVYTLPAPVTGADVLPSRFPTGDAIGRLANPLVRPVPAVPPTAQPSRRKRP